MAKLSWINETFSVKNHGDKKHLTHNNMPHPVYMNLHISLAGHSIVQCGLTSVCLSLASTFFYHFLVVLLKFGWISIFSNENTFLHNQLPTYVLLDFSWKLLNLDATLYSLTVVFSKVTTASATLFPCFKCILICFLSFSWYVLGVQNHHNAFHVTSITLSFHFPETWGSLLRY